ncbi:MAG TPA: RNA polymerase sigma factor RpoD/SigA [Panacibacter sp.]|nr:RNA polymerase sigma factor RpoD/SigA [Panacibacter sp.]HNP44939.1 RNA polymerase sigma factor RpoD/SigA [Panacibacter sp.]
MRQLKITKSITNRESASLDKYLQEIAKLHLITPEEEEALVKGFKSGDEKSMSRLIVANLRFVVSVAKQYQNQGLSLSDLINEGNLGLIKAGIHFDETKGFKFISYAVWWIRQGILQALADQSRTVRVPQNKIGLKGKIKKVSEAFEQEFEREPSCEELADILGTRLEDIELLMRFNDQQLSLDSPLSETDDYTLIDTLENENADEADKKLDFHESLQKEIRLAFEVLSQRQKEILCYFYGIGFDDPMSIEDIARKYNLTRERVRQIRDQAIGKLRSASRTELLRVFLG